MTPLGKPLSPNIFTLRFITVAKLRLLGSNKTNFVVEGHHNRKNCVLKGQSVGKVENHCSRALCILFLASPPCSLEVTLPVFTPKPRAALSIPPLQETSCPSEGLRRESARVPGNSDSLPRTPLDRPQLLEQGSGF